MLPRLLQTQSDWLGRLFEDEVGCHASSQSIIGLNGNKVRLRRFSPTQRAHIRRKRWTSDDIKCPSSLLYHSRLLTRRKKHLARQKRQSLSHRLYPLNVLSRLSNSKSKRRRVKKRAVIEILPLRGLISEFVNHHVCFQRAKCPRHLSIYFTESFQVNGISHRIDQYFSSILQFTE